MKVPRSPTLTRPTARVIIRSKPRDSHDSHCMWVLLLQRDAFQALSDDVVRMLLAWIIVPSEPFWTSCMSGVSRPMRRLVEQKCTELKLFEDLNRADDGDSTRQGMPSRLAFHANYAGPFVCAFDLHDIMGNPTRMNGAIDTLLTVNTMDIVIPFRMSVLVDTLTNGHEAAKKYAVGAIVNIANVAPSGHEANYAVILAAMPVFVSALVRACKCDANPYEVKDRAANALLAVARRLTDYIREQDIRDEEEDSEVGQWTTAAIQTMVKAGCVSVLVNAIQYGPGTSWQMWDIMDTIADIVSEMEGAGQANWIMNEIVEAKGVRAFVNVYLANSGECQCAGRCKLCQATTLKHAAIDHLFDIAANTVRNPGLLKQDDMETIITMLTEACRDKLGSLRLKAKFALRHLVHDGIH